MNVWRSISTLFPDSRASYQKEYRLKQAYDQVFTGSPSKEDQELVLADLAFHSGFAMVSPPTVSDVELRHNEGKRALFARIRAFLNLSQSDDMALENAARREAVMFYEVQAQ